MIIEDRPVLPEVWSGTRPSSWPRFAAAGIITAVSVGLFFCYLAMSRTQTMNADGASQALQAWDILHGNVLLADWTVSDVPFYTNELLILAGAEAVNGLNADAVHICAAVLYTLLVLGVAALARATATGREAVARVVIALAVMLVPMAGIGTSVLLLSPDHTGTAVPLLLTLIVIDRSLARRGSMPGDPPRWLPYGVALLLAAGQISDPLTLFIGVLPLVAVCVLRVWRAGMRRPRQWRQAMLDGIEARLAVAGVASVLLAEAVLFVIHALGGFQVHPVGAGLTTPVRMLDNIRIMAVSLSANFGAYFPARNPGLDTAMGVLHLGALLITAAVVVVALVRVMRATAEPGRFVDDLLVIAIAVNLGAFVVSSIPVDVSSARQIAPVLFLGAALAGRLLGPRLATVRWMPAAVAAVVLICGAEFVVRATEKPGVVESHEAAEFLLEHNLSYGLGGFWTANNITLQTSGKVQVIPVVGDTAVHGYRWLSKAEWYDPTRHDARFVVIQKSAPSYGTEQGTIAQFGQPAERHDLGVYVIFVYDKNLLVGLPAMCRPEVAPSMAECS
jgi:hypothetical protein